jgi:hypothetical protein
MTTVTRWIHRLGFDLIAIDRDSTNELQTSIAESQTVRKHTYMMPSIEQNLRTPSYALVQHACNIHRRPADLEPRCLQGGLDWRTINRRFHFCTLHGLKASHALISDHPSMEEDFRYL